MALTRVMALLIVVGNPILLRQDPNWRAFIDYVFDNGGYRGVKYERDDDGGGGDGGDGDGAGVGDVSRRLKEMGLEEEEGEEEEEELVGISQKELQEVPEWRADF